MKSCLRQADGEMQKNLVHFPSDTKNLTNETKKQRKRQFLILESLISEIRHSVSPYLSKVLPIEFLKSPECKQTS